MQRNPKETNMFDFSTFDTPDGATTSVKIFFENYGQELAEAALQLGGAAAEARVFKCAAHLHNARRLDTRSRRDLRFFYQLLSLDPVGDLEGWEPWFYPDLDPASPAVESICRLTELLAELLETIGEVVQDRWYDEPDHLIDLAQN